MPVSGLPPYDAGNIFARILRGEIPCRRVHEDEWALAFHDIQPRAPIHVLVIPKGAYVSFADFATGASEAEIAGFFRAVAKVATDLGLDPRGYRLLSNMGGDGMQEVPHFHVHLFGGRPLGPMLVEIETPQATRLTNIKQVLEAINADLSGSSFSNVKLARTVIDNADMHDCRVQDANLSGLSIRNANLAGASITDSRVDGMTIDGIQVVDLMAAYRAV